MTDSRLGNSSGLKLDVGNKPFSTTDTDLVVETRLVWVTAAIGITTTGVAVASAPVGNVTSGKVTFTRSDTTSADILNYILAGY